MTTYGISRETLKKVLEALDNHQFETVYDGDYGEDYNNDDVIEAQNELEAELSQQGWAV